MRYRHRKIYPSPRERRDRMNFKTNWNKKLFCDFFTTIRRWDSDKEAYYTSLKGKQISANVQDEGYSIPAKLIGTRPVEHLWDLPWELLVIDAGTDDPMATFQQLGIGKDDKVILNLLHRTQIPPANKEVVKTVNAAGKQQLKTVDSTGTEIKTVQV